MDLARPTFKECPSMSLFFVGVSVRLIIIVHHSTPIPTKVRPGLYMNIHLMLVQFSLVNKSFLTLITLALFILLGCVTEFLMSLQHFVTAKEF